MAFSSEIISTAVRVIPSHYSSEMVSAQIESDAIVFSDFTLSGNALTELISPIVVSQSFSLSGILSITGDTLQVAATNNIELIGSVEVNKVAYPTLGNGCNFANQLVIQVVSRVLVIRNTCNNIITIGLTRESDDFTSPLNISPGRSVTIHEDLVNAGQIANLEARGFIMVQDIYRLN